MNAAVGFKRARAYRAADEQGTASGAADVVRFWQAAHTDWFSHDPAFDRRFRECFLDLHFSTARRERDAWAETPEGSLALLILLDQFPRNAFRGTSHMYATDALARHFARMANAAGYIDFIDPELRLFFCLPFSHSEDIADQDLSVELNTRLGPAEQSHAEGHRDIIRRFGRFPHRNPLLLRETTSEEQAFLDRGGFTG
ncbi:DUF924 family protein [Acidovorax cavernicola]|uniref:DUF924 family protein n=1 Tax=Acidovorax cavernicola TaxID=1675792 RepID=A0A9X8D763_9BURK|nr:DUF924 family protein [Acidovorax cavernicola]RIX83186.1 DUF924 family protein [Acidovorax cavernicola]